MGLPDRHAHRQAQVYRQRSRALTDSAAYEFRDEGRRLHMLDLAATYQRVADEMARQSPVLIEHFHERF
jgi:nitrate reductase assembly molybdenum cofactor insertion protein NarJ